jgi:hypothetical protein
MNVVVDNEFARIWSDNATPIVFTFVRKIPEQLEMLEFLQKKQEELIKVINSKFNEVYCICDFSECRPAPFEILFECSVGRLIQQGKLGLNFKAFVAPKNRLAQSALAEMLNSYDETKASIFKSFEESLNAINIMRLNKPNTKKSVLGALKSLFVF